MERGDSWFSAQSNELEFLHLPNKPHGNSWTATYLPTLTLTPQLSLQAYVWSDLNTSFLTSVLSVFFFWV